MKILILNGPNLNLLGQREPEVYGNTSFQDYFSTLQRRFPDLSLEYFQSNVEGEIINRLHQCLQDGTEGIVINAGAYSHTSIAIADAIAGIDLPTISVHISNIYQREEERHKELIAKYATGGVFGLGLSGYEFAIRALTDR